MKIRVLIPVLALLGLLTSCKKELGFVQDMENNNNSGTYVNVTGTWRFAGSHAVNSNVASFSESGVSNIISSVLEYTSKDNSGTIHFSSNRITITDMAFTIVGTMYTSYTMNGLLIDEQTQDIEEITPPSGGTSTYVRNGNDTITVDQPPFTLPSPSGTGTGTTIGNAKMGMKLRMSNDTLYTRALMSQTVTIPDPSLPPISMHIKVNTEYAWVRP